MSLAPHGDVSGEAIRLKIWVAKRWVEAPVGAAVFLPRDAEHTLVVATETARMLVLVVPAGLEGTYWEVGDTSASSPGVEHMVTTAARYGCEITDPTPEVVW